MVILTSRKSTKYKTESSLSPLIPFNFFFLVKIFGEYFNDISNPKNRRIFGVEIFTSNEEYFKSIY